MPKIETGGTNAAFFLIDDVPYQKGQYEFLLNADGTRAAIRQIPAAGSPGTFLVDYLPASSYTDNTDTPLASISALLTYARDFFFDVGGAGGARGFGFNPNYIFSGAGTNATDFGPARTARDAYFTTNPDERVTGLLIVVVNTQPTPDVAREEVWTGSAWAETSTVLSPQQIGSLYESLVDTNKYTNTDKATVTSLSGLATGRIPVASGSNFVASSLVEETNDVSSQKPIKTPPSEIIIGGVRLRNSADIIYLESDLTNNRFFPCGSPFDNSGTSNPVCVNLGAEIDITAANQNVDTDTLTLNENDVMSFPITGASSGVGDGRHVDRTFTVNAVTTGTVRLELFVGNDSTGALLVDQTISLSIGLNAIELESYPLIMVGQTYFVRYTALTNNLQIRGDNSGMVFVPFFTVRGWPYSLIRVLANLPNQFDQFGQKASPVANDRIPIEDSQDSLNKKYITLGSVPNTQRTDEEIRDVVGATLVQGTGITIVVDDAANTITINATGTGTGPTPTPISTDFRYGVSSESDPALVNFAALTDEPSPTNPITISTGAITAGQYFHIFSATTQEISRITDTVLNTPVYNDPADPNNPNIFTKSENVRTEATIVYDSYTVGPLNANANGEDYVINFTTT